MNVVCKVVLFVWVSCFWILDMIGILCFFFKILLVFLLFWKKLINLVVFFLCVEFFVIFSICEECNGILDFLFVFLWGGLINWIFIFLGVFDKIFVNWLFDRKIIVVLLFLIVWKDRFVVFVVLLFGFGWVFLFIRFLCSWKKFVK